MVYFNNPESKLQGINKAINQVLTTAVVSKQQLQSLAGKLQFASLCIRPGRIFISRIYDDAIEQAPDFGAFRLPSEVRLDIEWWKKYMEGYNGVSIMWMQNVDQIIAFSSDACLTGLGGICGTEYYYCQVLPDIIDQCTSKLLLTLHI